MTRPTTRSIPLALLAGLFLAWLFAAASPQPAVATEKLGQDLSVSCTSCHDKPGSRLLTDKGKYFELMRSFDGLEQIQATMGSCTTCHVRKPGSLKLTDKGRQFRDTVQSMPGLRDYVLKSHPKAQPPGPPKGGGV
jgi:cytochrome c553